MDPAQGALQLLAQTTALAAVAAVLVAEKVAALAQATQVHLSQSVLHT